MINKKFFYFFVRSTRFYYKRVILGFWILLLSCCNIADNFPVAVKYIFMYFHCYITFFFHFFFHFHLIFSPKKLPSLYFTYKLLTLHRGRLLSCTDHDMMWHVYNYIIIDIKHGFFPACIISDVSQHIIKTTINIISMKYISIYVSRWQIFCKKKKISKAANIIFRFKRPYARLHHHFDDVCSNKTKMWFIVTGNVSFWYFSPYH